MNMSTFVLIFVVAWVIVIAVILMLRNLPDDWPMSWFSSYEPLPIRDSHMVDEIIKEFSNKDQVTAEDWNEFRKAMAAVGYTEVPAEMVLDTEPALPDKDPEH